MMSPVAASQMRFVLSPDPETPCLLSGENTTEVTPSVCPSNGPYDASSLSVPDASSLAETMRLLSGENATKVTQPVCPSDEPAMMSPVSASQMRIVLSHNPETMCLLSRENTTEVALSALRMGQL
jgi:hypothetical protein